METQIINPATKRQLWALFCITKTDYRNSGISFEEASKIISEASKPKKIEKIEGIKDYMLKDENIKKLVERLGAEFKIGSIVMNDTSMLPDDGKRYLFLGSGCGFSYIEYDKRNKKMGAIIDEAYKLRDKVDKKVISFISESYLEKLRKSGNPIQAHQMQNLSYKSCFNGIIVNYLRDAGFNMDKVWVKNIDD